VTEVTHSFYPTYILKAFYVQLLCNPVVKVILLNIARTWWVAWREWVFSLSPVIPVSSRESWNHEMSQWAMSPVGLQIQVQYKNNNLENVTLWFIEHDDYIHV